MIKNIFSLKVHLFLAIVLYNTINYAQEIGLTSLSQLEDSANSGKTILINKSFNLNGKTVTIAPGITIKPSGGLLSNGTIAGSNFTISTDKRNRTFNHNITFNQLYTKTFYPEWFGARGNGSTDDSNAFIKSITSATKLELRASRTYFFGKKVHTNRSRTIKITGNNAKIKAVGLQDKAILAFGAKYAKVILTQLNLDGENRNSEGIKVESSFDGSYLNLKNFKAEAGTSYGILSIINKESVIVDITKCFIQNISSVDNGIIGGEGDSLGIARAVIIDWKKFYPGNQVNIIDNDLTDVIAEDGDVVQIIQNHLNYNHTNKTIIKNNRISNATRRLIKATASNVEVINNVFRNYEEGHPNREPNPDDRTYMIAFQMFDPADVRNGKYVKGARFEENNIIIDPAWDYGNGGAVGFQQTDGAIFKNNDTLSNCRIVFNRFNQNSIISNNNKLINSNFDFVRNPVIFGDFIIENNKNGSFNTFGINREVKSIIGFPSNSKIEKMLIKDNSFTVFDTFNTNNNIAFTVLDENTLTDKLEILGNTLTKKTEGGKPTQATFFQSKNQLGINTVFRNNKLFTKRNRAKEGMNLIEVKPPYCFIFENNTININSEDDNNSSLILKMCPNDVCDIDMRCTNKKTSNLRKVYSDEKEAIVYPVPVTNVLQIENWNYSNSFYNIIDITGRKVMSGQLSNSEIDTTTLSNGTYTLILNSDVERTRSKFIK